MPKKLKNQWNFLVLDLKTIVILVFLTIWAIATIVDIASDYYSVPETINLALGGIIAYFTASKLKGD